MAMKGFYFSLDALTASMILIAAVGMLASYSSPNNVDRKPFELDKLHTASVQTLEEWNSSYSSEQKVLAEIYEQKYLGNISEAEQICEDYFNAEGYGLYFTNSTQNDKVCGDIAVENSTQLESTQTLVKDKKINGSFIGPKQVVMVVQD